MTSCACGGSPTLIFSCSGAADVGELADLCARKLSREKVGAMFCLAGVGGRVSGIVATTEAAERILAIDGCALNCARKTLEEAGIKNFKHLMLGDIGFVKGQTKVSDESVAKVFNVAAEAISSCK